MKSETKMLKEHKTLTLEEHMKNWECFDGSLGINKENEELAKMRRGYKNFSQEHVTKRDGSYKKVNFFLIKKVFF